MECTGNIMSVYHQNGEIKNTKEDFVLCWMDEKALR